MGTCVRVITLLLAARTASRSAGAQDFLTPDQVVLALVDGRPWSALSSDGKRAILTLNQDGTGTFDGPVALAVAWKVEGQALCIKVRVAARSASGFAEATAVSAASKVRTLI